MSFLGRRSGQVLALLLPLLAGPAVLSGCGGTEVAVAEPPRVSVIATTVPGAPATPSPKEPPPASQAYVVEPGDTIAGLASRFGVSAADIARASRLNDPNRLSVGQKLVIPPTTTTAASTAGTTATTAKGAPNPTTTVAASTNTTTTTTTTAASTTESYVVREGDTLGSIADKFDVTVSAIVAASRLTDPNRLVLGQKLTIPAPSTPTTR